MTLWDWLIVIIPVIFVLWMGFHSRKYATSVADFLSAGRVAGRYVLSMGDIAGALSVIGLVAYVEVHYKTGFALVFWNSTVLPLSVMLSLFGFFTYRFRETRAMSLGQFLEMRYNRSFRVFAAALRSISEMLANMIMPAIAARFFIYFLDLPHKINVFGTEISTFVFVVFLCMAISVTLICCGGTLALLVTDALQGMFLFPLMIVFVGFILWKFNWGTEMIPVMSDRVAGESFINPYDISHLRDFNLLMVVLLLFGKVLHRGSWIGGGYTTAAKTPHEQKMAGMLGTLRSALNYLLYILIAIGIITVMNHTNFAPEAKKIRNEISGHIAQELVPQKNRADFLNRIDAVPLQEHQIGKDAALSQENNLDTPTLNAAHEALKEYKGEKEGNAAFQEFRTLYHQLMMAIGLRNMLPPVMTGMFLLLMIMAMISTDDTRIFSSAITITQDVILPFCKKGISPKQHIWIIRGVSIGVGLFFMFASFFMAQLDYINLFVALMTTMWLGGCGPVMLFGLYSKFGNTAGAFASLITGMVLSFVSIFVQRNWADIVYPWLVKMNWAEGIGAFLETVSAPLTPYVIWKMDAVKFPINSYELYFMTMLLTLAIYCTVSLLTQKEPFNLDRMLHRGIYNTDGDKKEAPKALSWKNVWNKLIGITPEYTRGDRIIAWSVFLYSFIYKFFLMFIAVVIWNFVTPWPIEWWGKYFFVTTLVVPGIVTLISIFWFGIGGIIDLFRLFRDLEQRISNPLDNGQVEGHVSLADKQLFEQREKADPQSQK